LPLVDRPGIVEAFAKGPKNMPDRRELLRQVGGVIAAAACVLGSRPASSAAVRSAGAGSPLPEPGPQIVITASDLADACYPVPIGIRIGPLLPHQSIEWIELNRERGDFPGIARFTPPRGSGAVECQVRLERCETLLVTARLNDGTSCSAMRRVATPMLTSVASVGGD
jgi:hypothetical protein